MQRYGISIEGIVQGVGFRPFVYRLASRLRLAGLVRNQSGGVWIEAEGDQPSLQRFLEALVQQSPPSAQVGRLRWQTQPLQGGEIFRIESSSGESSQQRLVAADIATCADCLAEIFDPQNRRFAYPLTNCSHCGPRLSIITAVPYDRVRTTMAAFSMCTACEAEYHDPGDRRFHAQPIACPVCGPQLELLDAAGKRLVTPDPLGLFAEQIGGGRIGALKGLGGYHLVCHAGDATAVALLRKRKGREEKPLAIMVANPQAAAALCELSEPERELLCSPRAPIVLLRRHRHGPIETAVAAAVASPHHWLGVMLPYTPLHHLLLRALGGAALVVTSGNRSNEPIAYRDDDAAERLRDIADLFLTHNREIHVRCEDSVTRIVGGVELPLRRSRGDAPQPIGLATDCRRPVLAVGGQMKASFALGCGDRGFVSHHLGDLDDYQACRAFEQDVAHYEQLLDLRPQRIAHDLHPDYASTRYALRRAAQQGLELVAVQHHHAHMASCMVDNALRLVEPVIGVTFDGAGLGADGAIWGGEFLVGDCRGFRRHAHLRYVGMPGAEQAIREPWRMAAAQLRDAGAELPSLQRQIDAVRWQAVQRMLERCLNCPDTSSMGRLFDAVAAMAGVRLRSAYEGQAAMELESLAAELPPLGSYPYDLGHAADPEHTARRQQAAGGAVAAGPLVIDTRRLIRAVAEDLRGAADAAVVARRFHSTVVEIIMDVCLRIRRATGVGAVVLSGGVFLNALLTIETMQRLQSGGFRVYRHRQVPPGDGGLSLGQLAIAAVNGG